MYYDAYKQAFTYFCDQRSVSYSVLNVIAMKYVRRFCCLDFFVDENFRSSPLLDIWKEAEKKEESDKRIKKEDAGLDFLKNAPFVSKSRPKPSSHVVTEVVTNEPEKNKNRFVYIGNLQMHFTQLYLKAPDVTSVAATVKKIDPVRARLSYKDFIKHKPSSTERPDWTLLSAFPEPEL